MRAGILVSRWPEGAHLWARQAAGCDAIVATSPLRNSYPGATEPGAKPRGRARQEDRFKCRCQNPHFFGVRCWPAAARPIPGGDRFPYARAPPRWSGSCCVCFPNPAAPAIPASGPLFPWRRHHRVLATEWLVRCQTAFEQLLLTCLRMLSIFLYNYIVKHQLVCVQLVQRT